MANLYPHNQSAYDALIKMLETHNRACVIQPCGTGKAMIGFHYASQHPDKKILWLSPNEYIFGEQGDNLKHEGILNEFHNIEYMTYTAANRRMRAKAPCSSVDAIILDEFHRAGAPEWGKGVEGIISQNPTAKVIGFTATEVRYSDDGRNMAEDLFDGNIASYMSLEEAWLMGILPVPKYVSALYDAPEELGSVLAKIGNIKDPQRYGIFMSKYEKLRRAIVEASNLDVIFARHLRKSDSKIVVFCRNEEHLEELVLLHRRWFEMINPDIHVYRTYHSNPTGEKEYQAFKGDNTTALKVLYCINQLNEGVHIKGIDAIAMVRPTCSPIVFRQQLGRALDVGGNNVPLVFDFVNNLGSAGSRASFGLSLETEYRRLKEQGKKPPYSPKNFTIYDEIQDSRELLAEVRTAIDVRMPIEEKLERLEALHEKGAPRNKIKAVIESLRNDFKRGRLTDEDLHRIEAIGISLISKAQKRQVVCYETGEVFESIGDAARSFNIKNRNSITKACKNKSMAAGYHWYYADDPRPEPHELKGPSKRGVVCIETGEFFSSARSAEKAIGCSGISRALKNGTRVGGYYWRYIDSDMAPMKKKQYEANKRVVCFETGEVFENVAEAAQFMSVRPQAIYTAIGKGTTCADCHWHYENDAGIDPSKFTKRKHRAVACIETGEVFKNCAEAARSLGLSKTAVSNIVGKDNKTAGGYHWRYATEEEIIRAIPRRGAVKS